MKRFLSKSFIFEASLDKLFFLLSFALAAPPLFAQAPTFTPTATSVCCQGLTQMAGIGPYGFISSSGMAVDYPNNRIYVADVTGRQVLVFNSDTEAPVTVLNSSTGTAFMGPIDVAVDGNGNFFVADIGASQPLEAFNSNYTLVEPIGPAGVTANGVWAVTSGATDSVYFSTQTGQVLQYNGSGTNYAAAATFGGPVTLNHPNQLIAVGNWLYVVDSNDNQIVKFNILSPGAAPVTVLSNLLNPSGLRTDPAGNIYVVENSATSPQYLDEFCPDFSVEKQCPFPALGVWAPAVNAAGNVFVSEINTGPVTVLQGCGTSALPTATPTITETPTITATPAPPGLACDQSYAYPNPVSGNTLKIHLQLCESDQATVFIYNTVGELVDQFAQPAVQGPNDFTLQVSGWSYGVYYYFIQLNSGSGSRRLKPEKFAIVH